MSRSRFLKYLAVAFALISSAPGFAANHVRIILDTSQSMVHNDQPRLAVLSTLLLFDLAKPNLSLGDTFAVMPFDVTMPAWRSGAPPATRQPWIRAQRDKRSDFQNSLKDIKYVVPHTYYFPFLAKAIEDLKQQGTTSDRRVIILLTDGVPEDPDTGLIRTELAPQLLRENIRLYILALGPQATSHSQQIHDALGGSNVGELLVDPDGSRIPEEMIEIFSRSFGYTGNPGMVTSDAVDVDLEGQQTADHVAIVVYWRKPTRPSLRVRAEHNSDVNSPDGVRAGQESGGSYALSWILEPRRGVHKLLTNANGARFVVLRPATLIVEIQPQAPNGQVYSAIARNPFPLRVVVRPGSGNRGDPGPMQLSYQVHGPRVGSGFAWDGDKSPPQGEGSGTSDGRSFDIAPRFPRDPATSETYYDGYVTVEVRRGDAIIGSMTGDHAHHVSVYPFMHLQPGPPTDYARVDGLQRALGRHEVGCAFFKFTLDGTLPHPSQPAYSLRAVMDPSLRTSPQLDGAQYTLDNEAVSYGTDPGRRPGAWFAGRRLTRTELLDEQHQVCVLLAKPRDVDASQPLELNVQFALIEAPYDIGSTVTPFTLKVLIGPPSWAEKNAARLALALAFTALLLQLWYGRFRPTVPNGLQVATGNPVSAPVPLAEGSVVGRWLGLAVERPVLVENGSYTIGWIRPMNQELYGFRPASGVRLFDPVYQDGNMVISVNRIYKVGTSRGDYQFRLQYP